MSNIKEIISKLTLEEKAGLCSGKDFWTTKSVEHLGIPSIMMTDGPHGLRKQSVISDHLGINESIKTTCFPTAVTSACSWDRELLKEMGLMIAEECQSEDVAIILGPGVNIKRSPLCGRNFEYFSEDPFLSGEMATYWVKGVQEGGVGVSLKHFAANNQERLRLIINSTVDERALREIYLTGFEMVVKNANPTTLMCSYNKLDEIYCSENKRLLTEILRDEWNFKGFVMTDWGATNERVLGLSAGLDLEMPSSHGYNDAKIVSAVKDGTLDEKILDKSVERILSVTFDLLNKQKKNFKYDQSKHQAVAQKIAEGSIVLLKNERNILPAKKDKKIGVIGEFAEKPRFQGNGSSIIDASKIDTASEYFKNNNLEFNYARGYNINTDDIDNALIEEAVALAKNVELVFLFAGLTSEYESEGFDREHLNMPVSHNALIDAVTAVNKNVVVILSLGSPVAMPWLDKVSGLLNSYLSGQAGIPAIFNILFGVVNPSGKLAETFPLKLSNNPSHNYFPGGNNAVEYRESIFVGYRYYDKSKTDVLFPFGFGLSYSKFEFSNIKLSKNEISENEDLDVTFNIKNASELDGFEIAQLYISMPESKIITAKKELKGFEKIFLKANESKSITIKSNKRSFAFYNVLEKEWCVLSGEYKILVGNSSRNILLTANVIVNSENKNMKIPDYTKTASSYYNLKQGSLDISDDEFAALFSKKLPSVNIKIGKPFDHNTILNDIIDTPIGQHLSKELLANLEKMFTGDTNPGIKNMFRKMMLEVPFRSLVMMSGGSFTQEQADDILKMLNS